MSDVYLITGASSDLATAFLNSLESEGKHYTVLCQYHSHLDSLEKVASASHCLEIHPYQVNLADAGETFDWIDTIKNQGYEPDHILHVAAEPFCYTRIKEFDWSRVERQLTVQVNTFAQILKAFAPQMSRNHYGKVVSVLSSCVLGAPPKFLSEYVVCKYALLGLVKSAAADYAGKGININAVSPNMMETKFLKNLAPIQVQLAAKGTAMGRNATVEEVSRTIMFLMSEASDYMTGVNFNISGGDRM